MWDLAPFILRVGVNVKNKLEVLDGGIYSFLLVLQMGEFAQSAKAARKVHNERENYTKNGRNCARDQLVLPLTKVNKSFFSGDIRIWGQIIFAAEFWLTEFSFPLVQTAQFC